MDSESNVSPSIGLKAYVQPKDWKDLNDSEKIERMREQVKQLQSSLGYAQTQIHSLRAKLRRHEHRDGKVVEIKEVNDYDDTSNCVGLVSTQNNNYF